MKIALVGYGKMGKLIEKIAVTRGHEIVATIDIFSKNASALVPKDDYESVANAVKKSLAQGIIEFSSPNAVEGNLKALLPLSIPIVCGTTGWNEKKSQIEKIAEKNQSAILASSNFSLGVNLFYKVVQEAAKIFLPYDDYDFALWEMHHNQKADSPSGTALEIAKILYEQNPKKSKIQVDAFHKKPESDVLHVSSTRCGFVPGTHTVFFDSNADTIELTHRARSREGFALGAVVALERLCEKLKTQELKGGSLFSMSDVL